MVHLDVSRPPEPPEPLASSESGIVAFDTVRSLIRRRKRGMPEEMMIVKN